MIEHGLAPAVHGGDIATAVERYGGDAHRFLDFSANINPLGPPEAVLAFLREYASDTRMLTAYPDPAYRSLRGVISARENVPVESLVVANGAAALFDAIVRALRPRSCLVPSPSFSEYARALHAARVPVLPFALDREADFTLDPTRFREALEQHRPDLCILTNPHNPSGSLVEARDLRAIVSQASALNVTVAVDEAFIDYTPDQTLARDALAAPNLIVIRSLTKFYGMPALRVGYAVSSPLISQAISAQLPSWPISTIAAEAAALALEDPVYPKRTRALNERRRATLSQALSALGFHCCPSHANFVLMRMSRPSTPLAHRLASEHHILVRDCESYDSLAGAGYLRVAVRNEPDNEALLAALRSQSRADHGPADVKGG
jgi:threonine-phosphate decarboxylase